MTTDSQLQSGAAVSSSERVRWRRNWTLYASLHAAALVFLLLAQNWIASWFCAAVIYYCLVAKWREGNPSNTQITDREAT